MPQELRRAAGSATLETVDRVDTDSSFRREFLRIPAERSACHPALAAGHFALLSYPCPKARRNASDAGGNAGDLTSAFLPNACDSMRRMASDRDGRGSGCAAIQASRAARFMG